MTKQHQRRVQATQMSVICKLDDMNSDRTTKKVYAGVIKGGRARGRPMMRSFDNFKCIMCILVTSVLCRDLQVCSPRDDL